MINGTRESSYKKKRQRPHSAECESALKPGARKALKHTRNHLNCPICQEADVQLLELDADLSRKTFAVAAEIWMRLRKQDQGLKPRTHETNAQYIDALNKFFGRIPLYKITAGHLKSYQNMRAKNPAEEDGTRLWKHTASNSMINHEMCCLALILNHANVWRKLKTYYFPLPVAKWSPRDVLSEEDEEHLFSVAASHPECALAYWVACITNNTTASGIELRGLRLKHVFLRDPKEISEIYVPEDAVKNSSRPRKIALNRTARWAVEQCYKRAIKLGACEPNDYLFPFRIAPNKYDPKRAPSRWFLRKSWDKLREVTGFQQIKPHDLRHQCITRLLENGTEPETVRAIAGHVTEQMMQYYSHHRQRVKYNAVMAIELNDRDRRRPGPQAVRRSA